MAEIIKDIYGLGYTQIHNIVGDKEIKEDIILETVVIPEEGEVKGHVKDKDDKPIPGATVKIFDDKNNPIAHTVTDANGLYVLYGVKYGTYKVGVYAKDCVAQPQKNAVVAKGTNPTVNFTADKSTYLSKGFIGGMVFMSGTRKVIKDAKVTIKDKETGEVFQETMSAKDGEYLITGMPNGNYIIEVTKGGYLLEDSAEITVVNGGKYNVNLDMFPVAPQNISGTFNGTVRDKEGNPMPSVCVGLYRVSEEDDTTELLVDMQTTDNFGKYFFGDVQGKSKVKAIKDTNVI